MPNKRCSALLLAALAILAGFEPPARRTSAADASGPPPPAQIRRPAALVAVGNRRLLSCNARSGTLSLIDTATRCVVSEHRVAGRLAHMAAHPGACAAFLLDDDRHRLLAVKLDGDSLAVETIADVARYPVRLVVSESQQRVIVSSRWSRRVTILTFDDQFHSPTAAKEVQLDFPPQELVLIAGDQKLIVADAFGGQLAVIDTVAAKLEFVRQLPAHNIRGLALSLDGKVLYVSHQTIDPRAWTDREDIHWGILLGNFLRGLRVESLPDRRRDILQDAWLENLGLVGKAAGDPGPILIDERGRQAVALSGIGEVAVNGPSYAQSFAVGRRPSAMVSLNDHLYVANQFDDSISVIDLKLGAAEETIPLGPAVKLSARDRGELLFFDARLSHDRWMSCHSCHSEGHTIGLQADTLGDGGFGAPKRIPSLLATNATGPWGWTGSSMSLAEQIGKSVRSTMHGTPLTAEQTSDLAAFLESLPPPPSRRANDSALVQRGRRIFASRGCVDCHRPPTYTSPDIYDVGFVDQAGNRKFNPPSLRGLGQRDAFFHDGRASTLEEVIHTTRHQLEGLLSDEETAALLAFLNSL